MYQFSAGSIFVGVLIIAAGGAVVFFYRQISEGMASGVSSYEKVKLFGIIAIGVGVLIATSLYTIPLNMLVNALFHR